MIYNPKDYTDPNRWVVYSQTLSGHTSPAWIGYCRTGDLIMTPDAYASPAWRATVLQAPGVTLAVLSLHDVEQAAMRACSAAVRTYQPHVNLETGATGSGRGGRRVQCVETGQIYDTAAAAAEAHGIFASQMSVYLNRRNGGKVKGWTFRRI